MRGTGSPTAVLDDQTGRIYVFGRVGDQVYYFQETAIGSYTWKPGQPVSSDAVRSDPNAFEFHSGVGYPTSAFVVRNSSGEVALWSLAFGAAAKSAKGKAADKVRFTEQVLSRKR